jgi:hypothetical protein
MAGKLTGLGSNFYVDGVDLSGDALGFSRIGGGLAGVFPKTGIDKYAYERVGGGHDGSMEWQTAFNVDASRAHLTLRGLPTADRVVSFFHQVGTLGNAAASLVGKQINYDPTRGNDGDLNLTVQALANGYGLEWGNQLTPGKRTDTAGTNGTGVDFTTVSTAFGWQAWLHVFALTGTNVVLTLQDSADNVSFANLSGGAFTSATGVTSQRLESASRTDTVRRYLRVVSSGVFTSATFAVMFTRNESAVAF